MAAPQLQFDDADNPGQRVTVTADTQAVVTPGEKPDTAVVTTPDGRQVRVVGDHREIHVRIQAAAARAHESGANEQSNTPVS
jgi:urease beta subunit